MGVYMDALLPMCSCRMERARIPRVTSQMAEDSHVDFSSALTYPSMCLIETQGCFASQEPISLDCRHADEDSSGHPPL